MAGARTPPRRSQAARVLEAGTAGRRQGQVTRGNGSIGLATDQPSTLASAGKPRSRAVTQIPNERPVWQTRRFRLIVLYGSLGLLALILILQNFDTTEVQFLFWRAEAALAWVLLTFMILGAGVDELVRVLVRRRRSKKAAAMPREHPDPEF
jgi:uncharacterized integral membrane protein